MDLSQQVKSLILNRLDSTPDITAIVPSDQIFPIKVAAVPSFPFIRYDPPVVSPYEDTCGEGSEVEVRLSLFIKSEDQAQQVSALITESLTTMTGFMQIDWVRTQFLQDEEADVIHSVMDFYVVHTQ